MHAYIKLIKRIADKFSLPTLQASNKQVAREDTPGLKVWITSRTVKMPQESGELPVWGEFEEHIDITDGRPSGVCHPSAGEYAH
jgi:hypothetical protein